MRRWTFGSMLATVMTLGVVPASAGAPSAAVSVPTVSGPITGGQGAPSLVGTNFEFADVGYEREEYFLEGTATSFARSAPFGPDGKWRVARNDTAPYRTRIVVYHPSNPKDFNGTVFVEWLNVSAGFDVSPDWIYTHTQLVRSGAAYVGVSAQAVGVHGGGFVIPGATAGGLKGGDPGRYGTLSHPGDQYSYDMFSQAGLAAAGNAEGIDPLGGLVVRRVIAMGESQSAFRLTTYVNAVHPNARVYDGFLIHSRGGSAAGLGTTTFSRGDPSIPEVVNIRSDVDAPVLTVQTETDLTSLGFLSSRQPDEKRIRLWEIAGTAHADQYTGDLGPVDLGDGSAERELLDPTRANGGVLRCTQPINAGPAFAVMNAAAFQLERWVREGTPPPKAARIASDGDQLVRDQHGIVKGGIRGPLVDVPIATNTGLPNAGGSFCTLFGTTTPFDAPTVASLYPTHADYVKKFNASADKAVKAGFWLRPNAENFKKAAAQLSFG